MYVFLPDPGSSPEKLMGIMTGDKWERVTRPGFEDGMEPLFCQRSNWNPVWGWKSR